MAEQMNEIRTAVVNGPLGTVGMALCRELLAEGIETIALCYPGDKRIADLPEGTRVIEMDMREIDRLKDEPGMRADTFFHLAWMGTSRSGAE